MDDKQKALEQAIDQIEKQFGKGSIMKLGEAPVQEIEPIHHREPGLFLQRFSGARFSAAG